MNPFQTRSTQTPDSDELSAAETILLIVSLGLLLLTLSAAALAEPDDTRRWSISVDNDLYAAGEDRDYTAGLRITTSDTHNTSTQFGLLMFTPDDISLSRVNPDDRPYASLLYLGHSKWRVHPTRISRTTLTVGVLGSGLAEAIQSSVHTALGAEQPRGFNHQISDGGELTARLGWTQFTPLVHGRLQTPNVTNGYLSAVVEKSLSLGYITEGAVGIGVRLANQSTGWHQSINHFVTHLDEPIRFAPAQSQKAGPLRYWFAGVRIRARAYNAFYQGQLRHSNLTFTRSQLNAVQIEGWLGWATQFHNWEFKYALRYQSAELKTSLGGRSQVYGDISLTRLLR